IRSEDLQRRDFGLTENLRLACRRCCDAKVNGQLLGDECALASAGSSVSHSPSSHVQPCVAFGGFSNMLKHSRRFLFPLLVCFLGNCVLAVPHSAPAITERSRAESRALDAAHLGAAPEKAARRLASEETAQTPGENAAQGATPTPTIAEKTAGIEKLPGYFNLYWDAKQGKLWLEVDKWGTEFLYQSGLPAGIGSNDIGLDRGQLGATRMVRFDRSGPKVLLVQENLEYRALSQDPDERRAVRDSFAESALWGFTAAAEEKDRALVDATDFFLRDAHHVPEALRRTKQGAYRLDLSRSAIYLPRTKNFPLNTEVEATLTFTGEEPGPWVRQVTPSPEAITVREHHSFVQLPPPGYKPREYDARASFFGIQYLDYATPIGEPIVKRFIARHRLEKKEPKEAMSEPVEPIVYYLDRGAPEPIRSALLEGGRWWNQAFEAAGYKNAFRVELLPEGADMMDLRYNVIQWVHRATRGWSYGAGVIDPRTGEIIKGQVTLGSLRVRQDYLIAEALLAPYEKGKPVSPKIEQMALARLRQLAAHEVGHTLGLEHNYSASTVNRSSVMDYPPPYVKLDAGGVPDLSDAYAMGIGEWDKVSIAYGYQDFPPGVDEHAALDKILKDAFARGLRFLTDQDARPAGSSSSLAHLWDSGTNAVDELRRLIEVRVAALKRFGENNIREGAPMATLEDVLVPLYLMHRYQVEAASKVVGGMDYTFALASPHPRAAQTYSPSLPLLCLPLPPDTDASSTTAPARLRGWPSAHLRECCSRRNALAPRLAPRSTGAIHPLHSCRSPTDARGCSKSPQAARPDPSKSATRARRRPSGFCSVPHVRPRPEENPDTRRQSTLCPTRQFPSRRRLTNPVRRLRPA